MDLGCGTGVVSEALARRGFRVIGIDHSPEMLRLAEAKLAKAGLADRVELRDEDLRRPAIEAGLADVVTCQGVLHHLDDMRGAIATMVRLLRPGGSFYISEPCSEPTPVGTAMRGAVALLMALRQALRGGLGRPTPESVEAPIRSRELFDLLDEAGLRYEAEFLTHLPLAHRVLGEGLRLRLTLLISRPWRRRRGDILLLEGSKPPGWSPRS